VLSRVDENAVLFKGAAVVCSVRKFTFTLNPWKPRCVLSGGQYITFLRMTVVVVTTGNLVFVLHRANREPPLVLFFYLESVNNRRAIAGRSRLVLTIEPVVKLEARAPNRRRAGVE